MRSLGWCLYKKKGDDGKTKKHMDMKDRQHMMVEAETRRRLYNPRNI
jgi:hypothetical protein